MTTSHLVLCRLTDTVGGVLSHMPFLRFVAPELLGYKSVMANLERLWAFIHDEITKHEANLPGVDDQPRDLIDAFLMEIRTHMKAGNADDETIFQRKPLRFLFGRSPIKAFHSQR